MPVTHTHTGLWNDFGELYKALFDQLYQDGYQNDGQLREIYSTINLADPATCVTGIQIGI